MLAALIGICFELPACSVVRTRCPAAGTGPRAAARGQGVLAARRRPRPAEALAREIAASTQPGLLRPNRR